MNYGTGHLLYCVAEEARICGKIVVENYCELSIRSVNVNLLVAAQWQVLVHSGGCVDT